jgi:hypothetical protein
MEELNRREYLELAVSKMPDKRFHLTALCLDVFLQFCLLLSLAHGVGFSRMKQATKELVKAYSKG